MQGQHRPAKKEKYMLTKPVGPTQVLTASTTPSTSTAFTGYSKVRIATTVSIFVAFGTAPIVNNTSSFIVPANTAEHFAIHKGNTITGYVGTITTTTTVLADCVAIMSTNGVVGRVSITPVA